jgi:hypothetical protein
MEKIQLRIRLIVIALILYAGYITIEYWYVREQLRRCGIMYEIVTEPK